MPLSLMPCSSGRAGPAQANDGEHARAGQHPANERNSDAGAAFSRSGATASHTLQRIGVALRN